MRAGVVAARRQRERHAPEDLHLDLRKAGGGERGDRLAIELGRQADAHGAVLRKRLQRALIIDIDEGTDHVRTPAQSRQRRGVIGLDESLGIAHQGLHGGDLAGVARHRQGGENDLLAGGRQPVHRFGQRLGKKRRPFGAHHLADMHGPDRRGLGDAGVEGPHRLGRPVEEQGSERQRARPGRGSFPRHLHPFR